VSVIRKARRAEFQVEGHFLGARVEAVRATEIDFKVYEAGWRTITSSRSLLPQAIPNDPAVVKVSGGGLATYEIEAAYPSRFNPGDEGNPAALGILE
jgi:hypothetical protein